MNFNHSNHLNYYFLNLLHNQMSIHQPMRSYLQLKTFQRRRMTLTLQWILHTSQRRMRPSINVVDATFNKRGSGHNQPQHLPPGNLQEWYMNTQHVNHMVDTSEPNRKGAPMSRYQLI